MGERLREYMVFTLLRKIVSSSPLARRMVTVVGVFICHHSRDGRSIHGLHEILLITRFHRLIGNEDVREQDLLVPRRDA